MAYNGHVYISQNVNFLLAPAKKPILNLPDIKDLFLDMDQDGNVEIKNGLGNFVKLDATKEYSSIKKSWNADLRSARDCLVFDFNKDGYPDIYMSGLQKGNTFINSGEQDCDFEYFTKTYVNIDNYGDIVYDIENDGFLSIRREVLLAIIMILIEMDFGTKEVLLMMGNTK